MPISKVKLKKPQIRDKKLESNVLGYAYQDDFEIEIDPRQSSKEYCNTIIHECGHCWFPDLTEAQIIKFADMLTDILWSRGFRRIKR